MNKAIKLLFAFCFPLACFAQNNDSAKWKNFKNQFDNPYKTFEKGKIIGIQANANLSVNKVSNEFIYPFLFGGKLEQATIDKNLKLSENKQLNIETNSELRFVNLEASVFKNKSLNWYLKTGTQSRTYINTSNDAMRLVFKGNAGTSDFKFDNCNFYNINLNKIGGGLYYHNEKTKHPYNLSFGLFVQQVTNYESVKTYDKNYLQGNEDSFLIGLNYDAIFAKTDAFSANGMGLGSELIFNQKINDKSIWGFSFQNFGFANFKNNATSYSANGEFKFDGVFIAEIGRVIEENYFKNQLDSFTNPLTNKKENQSKTLWIAPTSFIYYNVHLNSGYYQIGLRHSGTKSLPVAELRYSNFIKQRLQYSVSLGTIGNYYLNTDINWAINRHWYFQAGIYNIEALALPEIFGGLGGNCGLQFVF